MVRRIYMTGVMSSGKTSIASALAKSFTASFYKEEINETLLQNTFQQKNPDGNLALLTQLDFLIKLVNAHEYKLLNNTQVIDTSFLTNSIFTDIVVPFDTTIVLGFPSLDLLNTLITEVNSL